MSDARTEHNERRIRSLENIVLAQEEIIKALDHNCQLLKKALEQTVNVVEKVVAKIEDFAPTPVQLRLHDGKVHTVIVFAAVATPLSVKAEEEKPQFIVMKPCEPDAST